MVDLIPIYLQICVTSREVQNHDQSCLEQSQTHEQRIK